jgi:hypothetical protein
MAKRTASGKAIRTWLAIPGKIEEAVRGLPDRALDLRGGSENWSIRETVHHLVEANLIASNIIIAALAKSGCTYDWSWVTPDASWMRRVGYSTAPIRPALAALRALGQHLSAVLGATGDRLDRTVRLFDTPGSARYTKTVAEILAQEAEHAEEHLRDVARTRAAHRSRGRLDGRPARRGRRTRR